MNPTTVAYHAAIAAGFCGRCHVVPHEPEKVYCKSCATIENARHRRVDRSLRRRWKCVRCRRTVDKRRSLCAGCRKRKAAWEAKRRAKRIAAGLCGSCGHEPIEAGNRCAGCRKQRKAVPSAGRNVTRQRRKDAGLCIECDDPLYAPGEVPTPGAKLHTRCSVCRARAADERQRKVAEAKAMGACLCGRALSAADIKDEHTRCTICRKKRVAHEASKRCR